MTTSDPQPDPGTGARSTLRLQVFLSRNGVASRRKAMEIVQSGKVRVNGKVVDEPSFPVTPDRDKVMVSGRPVAEAKKDYLLLNKPKGYVTTRAVGFKEKTVMDLLPRKCRHLHPVGRLDKDTEGLLLLTNDGDLTHQLTHPRYESPKTYEVVAQGRVSPAAVLKLEKGVKLEGKLTAPARVRRVKREKETTRFEIIIHEGRKRQVRLMLEAVGHKVMHLKRVAQGPLSLKGMKSGEFRRLTPREIGALHDEKIKGKKGKQL